MQLTTAASPKPTSRRERRRAAKLKKNNGAIRQQFAPGTDAAYETATTLAKAGKLAEAIALCQEILDKHPDHADARGTIGVLHWREKRYAEAYPHLKWLAEAQPKNVQAWLYFGDCLLGLTQMDAAVLAFKRAVEAEPTNFMAQFHLGRASSLAGDNEAALEAARRAEKLKPNSVELQHLLSAIFLSMGSFDKARAALEQALECNPNYVAAYEDLSRLRPDQAQAEQLVTRLQDKLKEVDHAPDDEAAMHFALGNLQDRLQDYDAAFAAYSQGNALDRQQFPFEREPFAKQFEETKLGFTGEVFDALKEAGSDDRSPVFIVGMPRSGTTLVEQIIGSHPGVHAGGELVRMQFIAQSLMQQSGSDIHYPRDVAAMDPQALVQLGSDYLNSLKSGAPQDCARITDKLPLNFLNVGLITVLLPNAKIVHCRRDPMDTCLSCFIQHFTKLGGLNFARDLGDLGFYYRNYLSLMDHWRDVLPQPMFEVNYEELVDNQEAVSRQLIAHLELEWDDACLDFHNSDRSVRTASLWQVRQPIYKSSKQRWKRYEGHLGPLKQALRATD